MELQEVVVIGGGPAGLTAGIYAARAGLKPLLIERGTVGGRVRLTARLENFPGFAAGVEGTKLIREMELQARRFGVEFHKADILEVRAAGDCLNITGSGGVLLWAKAVIIATGTGPQPLGVPGEDRLRGRGVSYCALADAAGFEGRTVVVVGGGDAAVKEALYLARYASRVYVVHRRDALRAAEVLRQQALAETRLAFIWNTVIEEVLGSDWVEGVRLRNLKTGAVENLAVQGLVVFIGNRPNSGLVAGLVALDPHGFILTDEEMRTSNPAVFAAGDVRKKRLRDAVTAVADGALAAVGVQKYLREQKPTPRWGRSGSPAPADGPPG